MYSEARPLHRISSVCFTTDKRCGFLSTEFFPPHFTLLFLLVRFVQFTDSPVTIVITDVTFDVVDVLAAVTFGI